MQAARKLRYIDRMRFPNLFRCSSLALLMASAVFAVCSPANAQQCRAMGAMPNMGDTQPIPPPEQLPPPVKMTGIGNSHIAIKASPEAQAWFDQGLSLLHDFWDYESARAFFA